MAEAQFKKAVYFVRNGPKQDNASNEQKLAYYGLYKQATEGDVTGAQPWAVQLEARAKWDAWASHKGTSKEDAMKKYVELVSSATPNWEASDILKDYKP